MAKSQTAREPKSPREKFNISSHAKVVKKPWGNEIHWVPESKPYMGKIFRIKKGARLSLQYHDKKLESWTLVSGRAKVIWDDQMGNLVETEMEKGKGYSCEVGQRHRLVGITDCLVIEVSTPEVGTTYRLEDDYSRNYNETEEMRKDPKRGWKE